MASTAFITGASSGIGEAVARRLAGRRFRTCLLGRDAERLAAVADECRRLSGLVPEVAAGDLRDEGYLTDVLRRAESLRPLDVLVNSAGMGTFGPTPAVADAAWNEVLGVNLTALFRLCREIGGRMMSADGGGTIVNVSSDADSVGFAGAAAYCASKGGVLGLSRALQVELRPHGVRVCVVSPGRVDTRFNGKAPGQRPGALLADEVAEVVEFAATCSRNIELREMRLDSMARHA